MRVCSLCADIDVKQDVYLIMFIKFKSWKYGMFVHFWRTPYTGGFVFPLQRSRWNKQYLSIPCQFQLRNQWTDQNWDHYLIYFSTSNDFFSSCSNVWLPTPLRCNYFDMFRWYGKPHSFRMCSLTSQWWFSLWHCEAYITENKLIDFKHYYFEL